MPSLYVHFPYCLYKCHYCDFNSYAVNFTHDLEKPYIDALLLEWESHQRTWGDFYPSSIFLGGGTPSLFSASSIQRLLVAFLGQSTAPIEITLEANPKTLTPGKIDGFLRAGVNRFSLGVQSLNDHYLAPLGRLHNAAEAIQSVQWLSNSRVSFNVDLMFGFQDQTLAEVQDDISEILLYSPQHLSCYQLTLEPGTILFQKRQSGFFEPPEDEQLVEMDQTISQILTQNGYHHYEISNFARFGFYSKHNLNYWRYQSYLGLGAGAVSFLNLSDFAVAALEAQNFHPHFYPNRTFASTPTSVLIPASASVPASTFPLDLESIYGWRWRNHLKPVEYLKEPFAPFESRFESERINQKTARFEFWMMGLRLLEEGVSVLEFHRRFREHPLQSYGGVFEVLQKRGWIEFHDHQVRLTSAGRIFANEVVKAFLID